MRLFAFLALCMACAAMGCAFTPVDVHPPAAPPAPRAGTAEHGPGRGREIILIAPFADARAVERCGMQKNGYQHDTADVRCHPAPGFWMADALARALAAEGFHVLRGDAQPGPDTIVVRGTVRQLFLEPVDGFFTRTVEGDFAADLVVTSASGLHAERRFYVKGSDEDLASTESVFQAAADDATLKVTARMANAIVDLVSRYPRLGTPEASAPTAMVTR